jgi:hypothetical protein
VNPVVIVILPAGGDLRRDRGCRRTRGFRQRVMRHFRREELVPLPVAVPSLPRGVEAPGAECNAVSGAGAAERLATLHGAALGAEPLAAITAAAKAKLDAAAGAEGEAVGGRRQGAPRRRFLDPEPDS